MPYQPRHFASIEPQGNPVMKNLVENLLSGYKSGIEMKELPGQMKRKREEAELANAFKRSQIEKTDLENEALRNPKIDEFKQAMDRLRMQELQQKIENSRTPEEALMNQMKLAEYNSRLRQGEAAAKIKDEETGATKTANQKRVRAVHSLMPMLANLINYEDPQNISLSLFSSDQTNAKRYNDLTTLPIESIMSGFDWQGVKENITKAENLVKIGAGENKQDYRRRVVQLSQDILREVEGLPGAEEILENMPKVKMQYKGQLLEVPLTDVENILTKYKGSKFYEK